MIFPRLPLPLAALPIRLSTALHIHRRLIALADLVSVIQEIFALPRSCINVKSWLLSSSPVPEMSEVESRPWHLCFPTSVGRVPRVLTPTMPSHLHQIRPNRRCMSIPNSFEKFSIAKKSCGMTSTIRELMRRSDSEHCLPCKKSSAVFVRGLCCGHISITRTCCYSNRVQKCF